MYSFLLLVSLLLLLKAHLHRPLLHCWPLALLPFSFRLNLHWPFAAKHALNRERVRKRGGGGAIPNLGRLYLWLGLPVNWRASSRRRFLSCALHLQTGRATILPKGGLESSKLLCPSHRISFHFIIASKALPWMLAKHFQLISCKRLGSNFWQHQPKSNQKKGRQQQQREKRVS